MDNLMTSSHVMTQEQIEEAQRSFVVKVFGWMMSGLLLTGVFSMLVVSSETLLQTIFGNKLLYFGLIIAQLGLVIWLSARIAKMSAMTATAVFLGFSILTGITLSVVFLAYTAASISSTFFVTAGTFGVMYAYGSTTRRDLTSMGSFMTMGLVGVIIASIVNMFVHNEMIYWITTYITIFIFVGLTAYDAQRIKAMSTVAMSDSESEQKGAIIGALALYLDFINLFLMLLRVLGRRK